MKNHFLIFVPGILGTELYRDDGEAVWGKDLTCIVRSLALDPERLTGGLRVGQVLDNVNLFGDVHEVYGSWMKHLRDIGYTAENSMNFGYDWRSDLWAAGDQLAAEMRRQLELGVSDFKIVAHSMGGLVVRCMLARHQDVCRHLRLFAQIGSPVRGSALAYRTFHEAPHMKGLFGLFDLLLQLWFKLASGRYDALRDVFQTFDSMFQLLPPEEEKVLLDPYRISRSALHENYWDEKHHDYLRRAKEVHNEIGGCDYQGIISYYSDKCLTEWQYKVDDNGRFIAALPGEGGDQVVCSYSANFRASERQWIKGRVAHDRLPNHKRFWREIDKRLK